MVWASVVSERIESRTATREAIRALLADRPGPPDLVFAFISAHHAPAYEQIARWLREAFGSATILGCSAAGVIGAGKELEGREAISLTGAWLPGVRARITYLDAPPPDTSPAGWADHLGVDPKIPCHFLLFVDPFTCQAEPVLQSLDEAFPDSTKVGGLVSGAAEQPAALIVNGALHRGGAVIVTLQGAIELRAFVAQSCRPVGEPYIVTRLRGNVIKELNAGKPAEVLRKVYDGMTPRDHALFNTSLFLGIAFADNRSRYQSGDFLIRNVLGIDPESGAMATDAILKPYQVVQFHLRDRDSAAQELAQGLRQLMLGEPPPRVRGALLFSCLGRGERLFGVANHDSDAFVRRVGPVSLSGFFGNGEIGPIGKRSFLHGYTSVFAAFCEP